jgi:ferredoxin-fold anticodon binding domain-containing protein
MSIIHQESVKVGREMVLKGWQKIRSFEIKTLWLFSSSSLRELDRENLQEITYSRFENLA